MDLERIIIVSAANNEQVLADNLASSPVIAEGRVKLIVQRGYTSASCAYNAALKEVNADIVIFAHQDVYLPCGWEERLLEAIRVLDAANKKWAVLGVFGVGEGREFVGHAYSAGLNRELGTSFMQPRQVLSVDEVLIILKKNTGIKFDEGLPGFHLYGTDIVCLAYQNGFQAYVFDGPFIHNSLPAVPDISYYRAWRYMQRKWRLELPLINTCATVERPGSSFLKFFICRDLFVNGLMRALHLRARIKEPALLARELGYEAEKTQP